MLEKNAVGVATCASHTYTAWIALEDLGCSTSPVRFDPAVWGPDTHTRGRPQTRRRSSARVEGCPGGRESILREKGCFEAGEGRLFEVQDECMDAKVAIALVWVDGVQQATGQRTNGPIINRSTEVILH